MKKIVTTYGLIAGAIVSLVLIIGVQLMWVSPDGGMLAMIIGFSSMLLAFCFIFVAIRNYRDKQLGGQISFGKAFLTGMWIALIASVCYTITWVIIYKGFYPEFMDEMTRAELARLQKSSKSAAEKAEQIKDMEAMKATYNTWPGLIGYTLMEILPLGLLVALVSALILKRGKSQETPAAQLA